MTMFWIICTLLLVVALLFVVLPLWRSSVKNGTVQRDAANLDIFRDQVAEMDADLRNGLLTPELYEQGKRELQARLLEEVKDPAGGVQATVRNPHKALAIGLAVVLPLMAVGVYWKIGNQQAFQPQARGSAAGFGTARSEGALKELEARVEKNPQDAGSLQQLARTYVEQERYQEAAKIYNQLTKVVPNEAGLWADFADALAMADGQNLAGHPTLLVNKALELDPNNPKALALAGSAAMGRNEFPAAIQYWERLLKLIPAGSEDAKMIAGAIQQARDAVAQVQGGKPGAAPAAPAEAPPVGGQERITGTVTMSDALKGKANPNDLVYILARAAEGPKMPLAVVRKQVKDLPFQFTLDDSMSMSPQMKLSKFDNVVVVARVSASGEPMPRPGDLEGISATLKPGSSGVKLSIDKMVK